ncbi:GGDEF domain-containing protein [Ruminococcus sp. HUN007]|uniref:GGDEF domain-containing protein n=1 Tax=Ruminococcus sp. HUN007 TaxID=1514668 RepID=UPI0005D23B7C|nr:GGDEF domain-containing protein [Ruminococcus sp. HUN007]
MSDKEIQKKNSSMDIVGPLIYIVIYIIVTLFIPKIGQLGGPLQGIVSQLLLLFSAFAVVAFPRYGYFAALATNTFQIIMTARAVTIAIAHGGSANALTGLITSVSAIILVTIIHIFYRRIVKNNEELIAANRVLKAKDEKLTYLAYYDILTTLPNRQLFIEKIDETITSSSPFTVIAANIDNFKDINNELGNNAGDAVLCSYSKKLKKLCGNSIFLARINGDEFGFILFGNETEPQILNYIDTIKEVISEPIKFNDVKLNITMSFGVAIYPVNATDSTEMLKCVSSALAVAKANGKNTHYFYNNSIRMPNY